MEYYSNNKDWTNDIHNEMEETQNNYAEQKPDKKDSKFIKF